jgi:ribosomal protein S18 acetylase RimI-like enzyme
MSAQVRPATLDDSAALAGLVTQLGYPTADGPMRARLAAILARADYATLLAESAGAVVGFGGAQLCPGYNHDRPAGRIVALVVDEASRGRGIGALLVRGLERWLVAAGAGSVFVNSRLHRVEAHRFYERLGYAQNGLRMVRALEQEDAGTAGPAGA